MADGGFPDRDADGLGPDEVRERTGVSRETLERVRAYLSVLDAWRTRLNLIGPGETTRIWTRHVLDSLQLAPLLPEGEITLVDLGTGAGFPGLLLACLLQERGGGETVLVEKSVRKSEFLRAAIDALQLRARVITARLEDAEKIEADVVTARALSPLPELLGQASPWLKPNGRSLFLKGRDATDEIARAQESWIFDIHISPSLSSADGKVLSISSLRRR
jgi:16S rRNA (guanine527-N7)-methyltransferase